MKYTDRDRLTALAGIFQAAWCAQGVAQRGMADSGAMETCIHSIFQTDADDVPSVFGGVAKIAPGLRQFIRQMTGNSGRDVDLTRYVIGLIQLESKLRGDNDRLGRIAEGIETSRQRLAHFHLMHNTILARLADTYTQTLSTLQPRIMVKGKELYLTNPDNVNRIRTLLLAGIRAARLWRQVGGNRWQILFARKRMMETAREMLEEIESESGRHSDIG